MEEEDIKPDVSNLDASATLTDMKFNSDDDIEMESESVIKNEDYDYEDQFYGSDLSEEKIEFPNIYIGKDGISSSVTSNYYGDGERISIGHAGVHNQNAEDTINSSDGLIMENVNSLALILVMKKHPTVWDTTCSDYKNRQKKLEAWTAICEDVVDNFSDIQDDRTKNDIFKKVQLRWKSLRDSFRKDHYANIRATSGSGPKKRKYVYANQMQFLLKTIEASETESNITQPNSDEQEDLEPPQLPKNFKKAKILKSVDSRRVEPQIKQDNVDSDETGLFFQSLLSSVKDFTEDENLQLKGGVISLITNIRRARNSHSKNNV